MSSIRGRVQDYKKGGRAGGGYGPEVVEHKVSQIVNIL